jgi:hypothetical protein
MNGVRSRSDPICREFLSSPIGTGFHPSFTAGQLHLNQVARTSGIPQVSIITKAQEIAPVIAACLKSDQGPAVTGMPAGIAVVPLDPVEIKPVL